MNTFSLSLFALLLAAPILFSSCRDDSEPNLSGGLVNIIQPDNNLETTDQTHQFAWEYMQGATQYRMQIASPSFDDIETFILDTALTGRSVDYVLEPGVYEWQVRGENVTSNGAYRTRSLEITGQSGLAAQTVELSVPLEDAMTNELSHTFRWFQLADATEYDLAVRTPDRTGTLVEPVITTPYIIHGTIQLSEGTYEWGVRGVNEDGSTPYNWRMLTIDTTDPDVPVLNAPLDSTSRSAGPVDFDWTRPNDPGNIHTPLTDSLIIYGNAALTNVVATIVTRDELASYSLVAGTYYWRVLTFDGAGNVGVASDPRTLFVF